MVPFEAMGISFLFFPPKYPLLSSKIILKQVLIITTIKLWKYLKMKTLNENARTNYNIKFPSNKKSEQIPTGHVS